MKKNQRLLSKYALAHGLTRREVNAINKSNQALDKRPTIKQSTEMLIAIRTLAKCNQAIRDRQAVDIKMLTMSLPAITSFQVLRRLHDQLEDLTIPYEQLEPIYAALIDLSKNFRASLPYFELIKPDCPYYEQLLEHQYGLAKNAYAINVIGQKVLQYLSYCRDGANFPKDASFEPASSILNDQIGVEWTERVVDDILKLSHSNKEAVLALDYVRDQDGYFLNMNDIVIRIFDKMLRLAESEREIDQILNDCLAAGLNKKEALIRAMKQF